HDAQIAERIHRRGAMIGDDGRGEEARQFEPAVPVWRAHHGDLNALIAEPGDTPGPLAFDHGAPFEFEARLAKAINRAAEVLDDDADIVHPLERHVSTYALLAGSIDAGLFIGLVNSVSPILNPKMTR